MFIFATVLLLLVATVGDNTYMAGVDRSVVGADVFMSLLVYATVFPTSKNILVTVTYHYSLHPNWIGCMLIQPDFILVRIWQHRLFAIFVLLCSDP